MLDRHLLVHGGAHRGNGGGRSWLEKLPRPTISAGSNQQDFKFFIEQWNRYKRASGDDNADKLRKHVNNSL
jgi:hypothetical protein